MRPLQWKREDQKQMRRGAFGPLFISRYNSVMIKSPIQLEDMRGEWHPKGSPFKCSVCGFKGKVGTNIFLAPNEALLCSNCRYSL